LGGANLYGNSETHQYSESHSRTQRHHEAHKVDEQGARFGLFMVFIGFLLHQWKNMVHDAIFPTCSELHLMAAFRHTQQRLNICLRSQVTI